MTEVNKVSLCCKSYPSFFYAEIAHQGFQNLIAGLLYACDLGLDVKKAFLDIPLIITNIAQNEHKRKLSNK